MNKVRNIFQHETPFRMMENNLLPCYLKSLYSVLCCTLQSKRVAFLLHSSLHLSHFLSSLALVDHLQSLSCLTCANLYIALSSLINKLRRSYSTASEAIVNVYSVHRKYRKEFPRRHLYCIIDFRVTCIGNLLSQLAVFFLSTYKFSSFLPRRHS